jgi:hypothetical protein
MMSISSGEGPEISLGCIVHFEDHQCDLCEDRDPFMEVMLMLTSDWQGSSKAEVFEEYARRVEGSQM